MTRPGNIAVEQLLAFVQRLEKLMDEKRGLGADIRDVFSEAKGNGFDVKALKAVIKERALDASEREERETLLDTYRRALGLAPESHEESEAGSNPPAAVARL